LRLVRRIRHFIKKSGYEWNYTRRIVFQTCEFFPGALVQTKPHVTEKSAKISATSVKPKLQSRPTKLKKVTSLWVWKLVHLYCTWWENMELLQKPSVGSVAMEWDLHSEFAHLSRKPFRLILVELTVFHRMKELPANVVWRIQTITLPAPPFSSYASTAGNYFEREGKFTKFHYSNNILATNEPLFVEIIIYWFVTFRLRQVKLFSLTLSHNWIPLYNPYRRDILLIF
jgi:hypothetical protein